MTKSSSIAFIIVAYYPKVDIISTLEKFKKYNLNVFVFNNGLTKQQLQEIQSNDINILGNGTNVGLGFALNNSFKHFRRLGFNYACIFDQDTIINDSFLNFIKTFNVKHILHTDFISVQIISELKHRQPRSDAVQILERRLIINSGSIFDLSKTERIGFHNKSYFVESVDYEFCIRARHNGFKVGVVEGIPGIDHFSNQDGMTLIIFGKPLNLRTYPRSRVLDFYISHLKLLLYAIKIGNLKDLAHIIRSATIFSWQNISSYLLLKFYVH